MERGFFRLLTILFICSFFAEGGDFVNYPLESEVISMAFHNDTVWLGTKSGAVKMDQEGNILEEYRPQLGGGGIAGYTVYCVWVDTVGGYVWFGTGTGLSRFDGESWVTYDTSDGARGMEISAFAIDGEGIKWVGTWDKASVWMDSVWNEEDGLWEYDVWIQIRNLPDPVVSDILIVPGRDFKLVSSQWGVSSYHNGYEHLKNFNSIQGVPGMRVFNLDVDNRDYVWLAAESGIAAFHCDTPIFNDIPYSYTEEDGLVSNQVNHLAVDNAGNVWVATWNGVSKLDPETEEFTSYDTSDGLSTNVIKTVEVDGYGNVWFGTPEGVSKLPQSAGVIDGFHKKIKSSTPVLIHKNYLKAVEFSLNMKKAGEIELQVYNCRGKLIKTLFSGRVECGKQKFLLDIKNFASGSYIVFLKTDRKTFTGNLIITN